MAVFIVHTCVLNASVEGIIPLDPSFACLQQGTGNARIIMNVAKAWNRDFGFALSLG